MAFKAQQDGAPADQALKTAKGQADMVGTMAGAMAWLRSRTTTSFPT